MASLAVLVALLAAGALAPAAGAATPDSPLRKGDFAGLVGIGHGRTIYLECHGEGGPTVILEAGLRSRSDFWSERQPETPAGPTVLPGIARTTRVCTIDRPGTTLGATEFSRSSPVPMPRTAANAVADLHSVLKAAGVPGPYVLAGHSTGGLIIRLYAATYPREVVGMVLVDALSEFLQGPLDPAQIAAYDELNNGPLEGIDYPDLEQILFRPSFAEMRRAAHQHPLADIPLTVISRGLPLPLPAGLPAGLTTPLVERAWRQSQDRLAALVPDAVHVIAKQSSHYVMFSQPRLIVDQVDRVVRAARERPLKNTLTTNSDRYLERMARGPEEAIVPTGRHGLAADVVAAHQRDRLFAATVELVAARGYRNTSIDHVVKAARVGYVAFYELYEGKEDCFLASFDRIVAETTAELALAVANECEWPRQVAAALARLTDLIVADPRRARIAMVEVQAAGPAAQARYEAALDLAVPKLRQGRAGGEAADLADTLEQAVLGGIIWVVHERLVGGDLDRTEALLGEAIQIALGPYLGDNEAERRAATALRERAGRQ